MVEFKTTLLTIGDDAFFDLIRNYLGPVKTPFNKHDLIARLISFLRRDEIQERIISLIDEKDAEVLTAVWILGQPSHEDLFAFLESDHSFLDLHNHLLNLEDRLLIYRDAERIGLNPELEPRIVGGIVHPTRLFGGAKLHRSSEDSNSDAGRQGRWLDDTLLVSFFSYLMEEPELYRADGALRKRAADALARAIPELMVRFSAEDEPEVLRIDFLTDALTSLGLVAETGSRVRPIGQAWHRWSRSSPLDRLAEVAGAGAAAGLGERTDAVLAAKALLQSFPDGLALGEVGLARLSSAATGVPADTALRAVQSMRRLGMLEGSDDSLVRTWGEEQPETPEPLVIQANFELTMPRSMSFPDALFVGEVGELVRHDRFPRFELTKDRVATAMRSGLGATHIAEKLSELADGRLPQNVATSIRTWEEEYESVRLYRGVVLQVRESRRYAVDHSPAVQELLGKELAPGTYLVDEADVPALQAGLRDAGVELVPELPPADPEGLASLQVTQPDAAAQKRIVRIAEIVRKTSGRAPDPLQTGDELRGELEAALAKRSLPAEQRQELSERIDRKLILSESQLKSGALRAERTEARGLDYSGKVHIVEQSLTTGGFLEVIERTASGAPRRRLIEPSGVRKEGKDLILEGRELPGREAVTIPISKLGLVRRLRATLLSREPND